MSESLRVKDLPVNPAYGVSLHCEECGYSYSATRGDYFMQSPDHVMICCEQPSVLVRRRTRFERISPAKAERASR